MRRLDSGTWIRVPKLLSGNAGPLILYITVLAPGEVSLQFLLVQTVQAFAAGVLPVLFDQKYY
jgi:hypothetical protein